MRFRVRRAAIEPQLRDRFEQCGDQVVALALGLGSIQSGGLGGGGAFPTDAMMVVHRNQAAAESWLREKRDEAERHGTRLEICEWSILLFVALSVGIEISNLIAGRH